jgi:CRISPR system Cascade subunit CasE
MYISKLELNDRNRLVHNDLHNIHRLHQRIMQAFPDEERQKARSDWDVLFRIEPDSNVVLVQSGNDVLPNWDLLPIDYLMNTKDRLRSFDLRPEYFQSGQLFHFRLKANPSRRDNVSRKTVGLHTRPEQVSWLARQATNHGFQIETVDLIPSADIYGKKKEGTGQIKINTVLFQGVLQPQDPTLLVRALQHGIGRGKSYGCGLLSLKRIG